MGMLRFITHCGPPCCAISGLGSYLVELLLSALGDEGLVDVWNDTTSSDGGLDEGVELLVSSDGELEMPWGDSLHLKILGRVSGQLENLGGEVLEDCGRVDGGGASDAATLGGPALQVTVDTTDRELKSGLGGTADGLHGSRKRGGCGCGPRIFKIAQREGARPRGESVSVWSRAGRGRARARASAISRRRRRRHSTPSSEFGGVGVFGRRRRARLEREGVSSYLLLVGHSALGTLGPLGSFSGHLGFLFVFER